MKNLLNKIKGLFRKKETLVIENASIGFNSQVDATKWLQIKPVILKLSRSSIMAPIVNSLADLVDAQYLMNQGLVEENEKLKIELLELRFRDAMYSEKK